VAGHGAALTAGEQTESVLEPVRHLPRIEDLNAGGGQLQSERDAVQAAADPHHGVGIVRVEGKAGPGRAGPLAEEADRVAVGEFGGADIVGRQRKRRHVPDDLAGDAEELPACGEDRQAGAVGDEPVDEARYRPDQMLAVVNDDEGLAPGQVLGKTGFDGIGRDEAGGLHAEGGGHRGGHLRPVAQRGELDQPGPVRVALQGVGGRLKREACLPHPSDAGQCQQTGCAE
jgi:hypothetical protein